MSVVSRGKCDICGTEMEEERGTWQISTKWAALEIWYTPAKPTEEGDREDEMWDVCEICADRVDYEIHSLFDRLKSNAEKPPESA
jgi:hypothetical protein